MLLSSLTRLQLALWLQVVSILLPSSVSAQAITSILPNFKGYYRVPENGATWTETCTRSNEILSTSGAYARCCTSGVPNCNFRTACDSQSSILRYMLFDGPRWCATGYHCVTTTIYASYPYAWKSWMDYACDTGPEDVTLYREMSSTVTTTTTTTTRVSTRSGTGTATSTPTPTSIPFDQQEEGGGVSMGRKKKKPKKGLIAGVAVGGVVGFGLVAGLVWFCIWMRRNKMKKEGEGGSVVREPLVAPQPYVIESGGQANNGGGGGLVYPGFGGVGKENLHGVQVKVGERE
ncbi:hypothetical protein QBC44DRAFT_363451 [Cladorrhinum sp. PSN332]|nr:hypothetical protein QBC44DRAFT_363451 [Cladorrhinum sp. PSN332]